VLSVSLVETEADFNRLERAWNSLLWESPRPVPFLTWEWVSTWWRHFQESTRLFVLVIRDANDRVVGIAPLRVATRTGFGLVPVRAVEFLGYRGSAVCADHLDFLTTTKNRELILARLAESLFAYQSEWDSIVLSGLAEDSLLPAILTRLQDSQEMVFFEGPDQLCPYVRLKSDWESFMKSMTRHRRHEVRRARKRLEEAHKVSFTTEILGHEIRELVDTLARLHTLSRQRKGECGNFQLREYKDFHYEVAERMAEAGYLYLAQLHCDGTPVAALYGFHIGHTLFDYQAGYDTTFRAQGVGTILWFMVIQDAIERLHATESDFLRGAEDYKYHCASGERRTRALICWKPNIAGKVAQFEFVMRRRLSLVRKGLQPPVVHRFDDVAASLPRQKAA
jgi:CelD/BcsL family acetyltransferase involved in cellulose biosynthesis